MKKIFIGCMIFLAVFAITIIIRYPYIGLISSMCDKLSKDDKLNITWERNTTSFPVIKLYGLRIIQDNNEIVSFERFDFLLGISGIRFKGIKDPCKIDGNFRNSSITYRITSLTVPDYLKSKLGKGLINASGTFNTKTKKGKGKFDATINEFPNQLITGSISLEGQSTTEPQKSNLVFNIKGNNISGKGTITLTKTDPNSPSTVSGLLELKAGQMPLMLNIQGNLNNISISPAH